MDNVKRMKEYPSRSKACGHWHSSVHTLLELPESLISWPQAGCWHDCCLLLTWVFPLIFLHPTSYQVFQWPTLLGYELLQTFLAISGFILSEYYIKYQEPLSGKPCWFLGFKLYKKKFKYLGPGKELEFKTVTGASSPNITQTQVKVSAVLKRWM